MTFQELSDTEKILFRTMKKVQRDRMEHQNAVCFSEGKKQEEHQRKKAVCLNKESVLEAVLDEAGLLESYKKWSGPESQENAAGRSRFPFSINVLKLPEK